ncbi:DUF1542 domain-containing protein, partial [Streptococcus sp. 716]|uniref:DUF1542 domain-containing protein n=1 Tax=Streptococcus sp. 716 TaxID=2582666 RepID=UPI001562C43D
MFYSEKDDREKRLRFSIRKVSFGAASVAVAALYLFMGSGAVSAEEAQAVQSNEEVAADKDSETEKKSEEQQPTYAAPAAKEQGSATNTEAGDEGKQESHPETKEEEANSSERSETTTKTQSDENSVSGDSSSPKSEGEGTKSEEASSKPKVRKRRAADSAPTVAAADEDPDANQTYEAPEDGASVDDLAAKLKALPETVENEKKLAKIDEIGATQNITPGQVSDLDEFGGWKAVNGGKFGVARKTDRGVFPIETVNTVFDNKNSTRNLTWIKESVFDRSNDYILLLSEVRTQATRTEQTFDKQDYKSTGEGTGIARGLEGFNGIEKTFKVYTPKIGTKVIIEFKTGYTGDIDGRKAKYKVELIAKKSDSQQDQTLYDVTFDPSQSSSRDMTLIAATETLRKQNFSSPRTDNKEKYNELLANDENTPGGTPGKFKSKLIDIPKGYTEYTVRISSADNQHLGMGYQINWKHYALPVTGTGFAVTQDTSKVAKDLAKKVYDKLTEQRDEDTKWSTPETKAAYEAKLQEIKDKLASEDSTTSNYKDVVTDALEKREQLDEEQQIKNKAKDAVAAALAEKEEAIEANSKLSEAEKTAAKAEAKAEADKAKEAITNANSQAEVTEKETEGTKAIGDVTPIGTDMAVDAIAAAAARKMAEIEDNETLSEDEKKAAKEKVVEAVTKAGQAIRKAKETKNQDGVEQAKTEVISEVTAINPVGKDKATKAIEDKLKEKEAEIDKNDKLSPREKEAAKQQAQAEAEKAKQAITNANSQAKVTEKETEGTKAIDDVNPIGTENAVNAIAEAAAVKMAEIEDDETLSEDEKNAAKEEVAEAVRKAGEAIRKAKETKNQDGVEQAKTEVISEVTAINPVGKDKAIKAIEDKLKEKEKAIDNNSKLSPREKAEAKQQAKAAADKAKQAITDAQTQDDVNMKEAEGTAAIGNVNPVGKDKAKEAVDAKLKEKEEEIDNNNKLSPREKEAAKQQAQAEADKAKQAITNANSQDEVTEKETEGTTAIGDVNPIGTDMAVDAIAEAAARRMAEIDDDETLSEDEKKAAKEKVEEAVTKAAQAIKKAKDAKDQGGVDKAQEDAISEVTAVKPVAKDKAKADLEKAAQAEKAAIAADKSLTAAQRAEKEQAVEEARKAAEAKIDSAEDADKVAEAKTAGVTAIEGVHTNGDLEALKKAAKADLEK